MSKRGRYDFDTPISPPETPGHKRRRTQSSPIRQSWSFLTPSTTRIFRTPHTVPLDSPTNPFGLKRSLIALDLPPPTKYKKHICLRFQIVEKHRPSRHPRGGTYRVVQVPLNYTMHHLHKIILFIFAPDVGVNQGTSIKSSMKPRTLTSKAGASHTIEEESITKANNKVSSKGKGKARATPKSSDREIPNRKWSGHYFEVLHKVTVGSEAVRPGEILVGGKLWSRLSSVRERRLFRDLYESSRGATPSVGEDDESESASTRDPLKEDEPEGWQWESEDDMTMAAIWPKGPDLSRGIVYHHSPGVTVHITANTLPIEFRRGIGNTPYVFLAQGSSGTLIQRAHVVMDATGREAGAVAAAASSASRTKTDASTGDATSSVSRSQIGRWNKPGAFEKFMQLEAARERAAQGRLRSRSPTPDISPTSSTATLPGLLFDDRSSSSEPHHLSSDDEGLVSGYGSLPAYPCPSESEAEVEADLARFSEPEVSCASDYDTDRYSDSIMPLMSSFPTTTPFPANPLKRRRVAFAERRIQRLSMSGLKEMAKLSDDEESHDDDEDAAGESDEEEDEEEVDEVAADDEEDDDEYPVYVEPKRRANGKTRKTPRARRTLPTRRCKLPPGVERDETGRIVDVLGLLERDL